jgi:hypothetical protein
MKTLAQKIRLLDETITPHCGLDKTPFERNEFEGELSNILCGLRLMMEIVITEGDDEDIEDEIAIYESRIKGLLKL